MLISPSTRADKKWMAERDGKRVHFGGRGYDDYTTHKDPERRRLYIARHSHEDYSNPMTPAWLSRYLLWEKPTLLGAIRAANAKGVRVRMAS